jgi:hypothetical protein
MSMCNPKDKKERFLARGVYTKWDERVLLGGCFSVSLLFITDSNVWLMVTEEEMFWSSIQWENGSCIRKQEQVKMV